LPLLGCGIKLASPSLLPPEGPDRTTKPVANSYGVPFNLVVAADREIC